MSTSGARFFRAALEPAGGLELAFETLPALGTSVVSPGFPVTGVDVPDRAAPAGDVSDPDAPPQPAGAPGPAGA